MCYGGLRSQAEPGIWWVSYYGSAVTKNNHKLKNIIKIIGGKTTEILLTKSDSNFFESRTCFRIETALACTSFSILLGHSTPSPCQHWQVNNIIKTIIKLNIPSIACLLRVDFKLHVTFAKKMKISKDNHSEYTNYYKKSNT